MNKNKPTQVYLPNGDVSTPFRDGDGLFRQNQIVLKRSSKGAIYWDVRVDGPNESEVLERATRLDQAMMEYKERVES